MDIALARMALCLSWRVWIGRTAGRHSAAEKGLFFSYQETSIIISTSFRANAYVHSCFASSVIFMFVAGSTGRRRHTGHNIHMYTKLYMH